MREFVLAMRAIWNTWLTGEKLEFRGEFYQHTLMTPMFSPSPSDLDGFGPPKMFLAGVGPLMTEVAGEAFDGFICHGFTTEKYLREVTIPALKLGREKAGKTMEGFEIVGPSFVVTGNNDEEIDAGRHRHPQADRVLRLDARLPAGARDARVGRAAGRAEQAVEAG